LSPEGAHTAYERAALVGCGLIGGSLLLALRAAGVVKRAVGCDKLPNHAEQARARGIVDEIAPLGEVARGADLIVLAVPVGVTAVVCEALAPALSPDVLVTDVGSTKVAVLAAVERALPFPERFVGAHPIAGTERSGPDAADATLFRGRRCLLTPTAATRAGALEACRALWESVGAHVDEVEAEPHDRALAWVSHLPHVAAFALAAAVGSEAVRDPLLEGLSGGGFVDTTRIAASDPTMWRDVLLSNRDAVAAALRGLEEELAAVRRAMAGGDGAALEAMIARAHAGRRRVLGGKR
jgi:prephenate dehydrogenase